MNKYIKIALLLLLTSGVFVGCGFFDVKPKTEVRATDMFEDELGFWDALTGIYINMGGEYAYGADLSWRAIEFMGWNHANSSSASGSYFDLQMNDYTAAKAENFVNRSWARLYNIIAEANYLLEALEEYGHVLKPHVYDNIKGQALAIRAFCHFDLMRLYAQGNLTYDPARDATLALRSIPYVKKYSIHITPQKSYGETLQMAMDDVTDAIELFEAADNVPREDRVPVVYTNMNRFSAKLLAARIELWRGNLAEALGYAMELVEETERSDSSFKWATDVATDNSGLFQRELMFYITVDNLYDLTERSWDPNSRDWLVGPSLNSVHEGLYRIGTPGDNPALEVSTADLRLNSWYIDDRLNTDDPAVWSTKIRRAGVGSQMQRNVNTIVPLMRMSEPFLIAAECLVTTDPEAAIGLVNTVRAKRNNSRDNYVPATVTEEELREVIMYEQAREFVQEGQVFFMYKRLNTTYPINTLNTSNPMNVDRYMLPYPDIETDVSGHTNE